LEREPARRDRLPRLGLEAAPGPGESPEATEALLREAWGELPGVVVDATGSAASMRSSLRYAAHGGRVVFAGLCAGDVRIDDPEFHRRELTLLATRNGTAADFARVIAALRDGRQQASAWVTHRLEPAELPERMAGLADPAAGCLKSIVRFAG